MDSEKPKTPKRLGLDYGEPNKILKDSIRKNLKFVIQNLQRDLREDEDRDALARQVVELHAQTDLRWEMLKDLPACPIITYIRKQIRNRLNYVGKHNQRLDEARVFGQAQQRPDDEEESKDVVSDYPSSKTVSDDN